MALEGLNAVLAQLKRTRWQDQQSFEKFVSLWPDLVGPEVAAQTRPTKITTQDVLQVATASGVWAQNLAFERIRILKKVNAVWPKPIKDIHFSAQQWHCSAPKRSPKYIETDLTPKPRAKSTPEIRPKPETSQEAFLRWSNAVRRQASRNRLRCPICECWTPLEELKRWNRCALCTARLDVAIAEHSLPQKINQP
jgi:predicted nucleic acid-binding Zn ribbon protein